MESNGQIDDTIEYIIVFVVFVERERDGLPGKASLQKSERDRDVV